MEIGNPKDSVEEEQTCPQNLNSDMSGIIVLFLLKLFVLQRNALEELDICETLGNATQWK